MPKAPRIVSFDDLPLFASDAEIGAAVVGAAKANHWASVTVKRLELQPGFPRFDEAHGGRYTPGVRKYYEVKHGSLNAGEQLRVPEKPEDNSAWTGRRSRRQG
jgi:hypothetical protein